MVPNGANKISQHVRVPHGGASQVPGAREQRGKACCTFTILNVACKAWVSVAVRGSSDQSVIQRFTTELTSTVSTTAQYSTELKAHANKPSTTTATNQPPPTSRGGIDAVDCLLAASCLITAQQFSDRQAQPSHVAERIMERDHNHMLAPDERPPSYTPSHHLQNMHLSEAPAPEISSAGNDRGNAHGSMSQESITRPADPPVESAVEPSPEPQPMATTTTTVWPSSNPFTSYYRPPNGSPRSARGVDSPGAMDLDDSRGVRGGSVLSIDDPDVRLAAEALGDLRADFVQSPPSSSRYGHRRNISGQPEPLLSLLTTSHPLVGTAIDGSISAYSASKNYSPRFKSTAEYVERRVTPVVNKVGTVGRATGVEGGVRWFLGGRRRAHNRHSTPKSNDDQSSKRRKTSEDTVRTWPYGRKSTQSLGEEPLQHRERRNSLANSLASSYVESLPAYDEYTSPSYEASQTTSLVRSEENDSPGSMSSWQSRLIMSTSGLSIAMSVESLRSLKYCLGLLRWANEHIGKIVTALKEALEDSNSKTATPMAGSSSDTEGQNVEDIFVLDSEKDREVLTRRIAELKADVLKTLKDVVDVVSKYAGGALPENARVLVRSHLTSLPQRFKMASTSTPPDTDDETAKADWETREGAKRVMVLAKEGLDMMTQVSGVLDGTIVSAEEWCERLGKKTYSEETAEDILKEGLVKPPPVEHQRSAFDATNTPPVLGGDGDYRMGQAL
ncbi:hypothetical protein V495_04836 [Pseudogymnoascus sp. VKM F-4514 (FW-929)]|nr:hypothetical protein V495_04836 [Pseudogymnoascus sp. VKM F-4514 (FW-929)]KFY59838.1 hypothetical protein V497_04049 [Pseudogymnoascus sp. VKM F-4516 (FW-969)]